MDLLEQENQTLRDEMTNVNTKLEELTTMMATMMAAQAQTVQAQTAQEQVTIPQPAGISQAQQVPIVSAASTGTTQPLVVGFSSDDVYNAGSRPSGPQYYMPPGYPWGIPRMINDNVRLGATEMTVLDGQQSTPFVQPSQPILQAVMTHPRPYVHTTQQEDGQIYHSDSVVGNDGVEDLREKYDEMHQEMKALRHGKEAYSPEAHELCLVPDVVIPPKFKTPDFEKYKGNTCPRDHLTMYVRKMSANAGDDKLLIHCFLDSLADPASRWYMKLKKDKIRTFSDLGRAFIQQYDYNGFLIPDREQLRTESQGDRESFRAYARRWRDLASQVIPPMGDLELTKIFIKTLNSFYYRNMVATAPQNFNDMVIMGMRLEEGVREGRLTIEGESSSSGGSSSGTKKFGNGYPKKGAQEVGMVAHSRSHPVYSSQPYVANLAPQIPTLQSPNYQPQRPHNPQPYYPPLYQPNYQSHNPQQLYQQPYYPPPHNPQQQHRPLAPQQNRPVRNNFPPIPMLYKDLLPSLLARNLVQTKPPPRLQNPIPHWHRPELTCEFHQGAPGHDVEHCYALKDAVQKLIQNKELSFADSNPVVQNNPLPPHEPAINMIQDHQEDKPVLYACDVRTPLVPIHAKMCEMSLFNHDHETCNMCSEYSCGCLQVQEDIQRLLDTKELIITRKNKEKDVCVITPVFKTREPLVINPNRVKPNSTPLVICPPEQLPYTSQRAIPYNYERTILENGKKVPLDPPTHVDNIAESSKILRSGRVIPIIVQKDANTPIEEPVKERNTGKGKAREQPSGFGYEDSDEILKLIKKSEYKIVDQLLQTPAKISIMSLLSSSDAHRDTLMKVLDQAYVDYDVTLSQFGSIVGNVTACNNLSFNDEDLPVEGKNHNLALLISVFCKSDSLSNVLIDTGSALNVMPKSTLDQLAYSEAILHPSKVTVRAFDGTRREVYGEINLPITVGPREFKVTFQVMEIQASFSCLLGRPWIHNAGAVTSTLHQKLKFVSHGKLITVSGESALLVSNLSAFSFIGGSSADGSSFQGLSVEESVGKIESCMASLKDAQRVIQEGKTEGWGQLVQLSENKRREGIGFPNSKPGGFKPTGSTFHSAGFIHAPPETNAIIEDSSDEVAPVFVTPGRAYCNWIAVDVPSVMPYSK